MDLSKRSSLRPDRLWCHQRVTVMISNTCALALAGSSQAVYNSVTQRRVDFLLRPTRLIGRLAQW